MKKISWDSLKTISDNLVTKFDSSVGEFVRLHGSSFSAALRIKPYDVSSETFKNSTIDTIQNTCALEKSNISDTSTDSGKDVKFKPFDIYHKEVHAADLEIALKKLGRLPAYLYLEYIKGIINNPSDGEMKKWKATGVLRILSTDKIKFLVKSLKVAKSESALFTRLCDLHRHLTDNPADRSKAHKEGCVPILLYLKSKRKEVSVQMKMNEILAVLGYVKPVRGSGLRILSIDGGGTRGILGLQILKYLEAELSQPLHEVFDYICGVSTGAIIAMFIGADKKSSLECEDIYKELSSKVFSQNTLVGAGSLLWSHSYYNTDSWVNILQDYIGSKTMLETTREGSCPMISCVSTLINTPRLRPYIFRNYNMPPKRQSQYLGSSGYKCWEAVRASAAAPGYFKEFCIDEYVHQDGGVLTNNPTGIGIHEARILWPSTPIQCVVSLGTGRYEPLGNAFTGTPSWKTKFLKLIDGATDTEEVHIIMNDLIPGCVYFRFNPYLSENIFLDENRPEKLASLKADAQLYIRKNEAKLQAAVKALSKKKTFSQKALDAVYHKTDTLRGYCY